jgi:hypothetical protein
MIRWQDSPEARDIEQMIEQDAEVLANLIDIAAEQIALEMQSNADALAKVSKRGRNRAIRLLQLQDEDLYKASVPVINAVDNRIVEDAVTLATVQNKLLFSGAKPISDESVPRVGGQPMPPVPPPTEKPCGQICVSNIAYNNVIANSGHLFGKCVQTATGNWICDVRCDLGPSEQQQVNDIQAVYGADCGNGPPPPPPPIKPPDGECKPDWLYAPNQPYAQVLALLSDTPTERRWRLSLGLNCGTNNPDNQVTLVENKQNAFLSYVTDKSGDCGCVHDKPLVSVLEGSIWNPTIKTFNLHGCEGTPSFTNECSDGIGPPPPPPPPIGDCPPCPPPPCPTPCPPLVKCSEWEMTDIYLEDKQVIKGKGADCMPPVADLDEPAYFHFSPGALQWKEISNRYQGVPEFNGKIPSLQTLYDTMSPAIKPPPPPDWEKLLKPPEGVTYAESSLDFIGQ